MEMNVGLVLLAAGTSSRMGENKLLLPWGDGTVIERAAHTFSVVNGMRAAVVSEEVAADSNAMNTLYAFGYTVIINAEPFEGQSRSLRLGMEAIEQSTPAADGVMCAVADQPCLSKESVRKLLRAFETAFSHSAIVWPRYGEAGGPPVIFGCRYFDMLKSIEGDRGGRTIIREAPSRDVIRVDIPLREGIDIDTKDIYRSLCASFGAGRKE